MEGSKDYFIGLDMGTSSVGWAVTDTAYNILRKKGKDLWGIREFDEANNSAERRTARTSRRRRIRETARIEELNRLFKTKIEEKDEGFFYRLSESKYYPEDKKINCKYAIFADKNYTDVDYYKDYPTIFHLRKALIQDSKCFDIRLIYLAILNMFKHRGHFLDDINVDSNGNDISELYNELIEKTSFIEGEAYFEEKENIKDLLCENKGSRKATAEFIADNLNINSKHHKIHYEIIKAFCGLEFKPLVIFNEQDLDKNEKVKSLSFRENAEEKMADLENILTSEKMELIELIKKVHDNIYLSGIMKNSKYLSFARVEEYEKHKKDLRILKKYIKENCSAVYDSMFRKMEKGSYSCYVGSVNSKELKYRRGGSDIKCDDKQFFDNIKKILKDMPQSSQKEYILNEIEKESFLPKQLTYANGVIPNQVHVAELKAILKNAEKYYPFLLEKDERGLTVSEKIIQLFSFHIPYYVGPLINTENNTGWVVRKEKGKVLPWNFEEKIDVKKSAQSFIENLINSCTYLSGQKVLPKNSLLYEKFMVLDELNNLKIDNNKISVELKQDIYNDLFLKGKRVTGKQLEKYLIGKGIIKAGEGERISGIDKDFKSSLSSYGKFKGVFGEKTDDKDTLEMIEEIISLGTIYGDDKKFYSETVAEKYGKILTEEQFNRIKGFKFKDWGRFSKEFLLLKGCRKDDGEILPFIDMMWERNENHMELLSDNYTYMDEIKSRHSEIVKTLTTFTYEDIEDLYLPSPVKRMLWQAVIILKEIVSVMGCEPKRIFIEMPRGGGEKGKTKDSRKKELEAIYRLNKKDPDIAKISETLKDKTDADFRQKKIYLYYMQKGKCMYTGETIPFTALFDKNLYDIDHIYPRHFVKDDSIHNNLVLVKKQVNAHKSDTYPLEDEIYKKMHEFWHCLKEQKLITEEKYKRLTNRNPFTDKQLEGFINRQLVETGQATKATAHLLETLFRDTNIVYVKAGLASQFRDKFEIYKSRLLNDFHHAQDAYLNIVVGNIYYVMFTNNIKNFIKCYRSNPEDNRYHMDKFLDYTVKRNGETAWDMASDKKMISTVKNSVYKTTPLLTRMSVEGRGRLYEATIYGKNAAKKSKEQNSYIPIKSTDERLCDVSKYGGFSSFTGTYFFLVEHELKGKKIRTLETMPLYLKEKAENNSEFLKEYCVNILGLINPDIRIRKIKLQSLVKINGYYGYISGRTDERITLRNAVMMCLTKDWIKYIKKIENIESKGYIEDIITEEKNIKLYNILLNKHKSTIFSKRPNPVGGKLENGFEKFKKLTKEEQCKVLIQVLKLSIIGNISADLKLIGESTSTGIMRVNKKISNLDECILIYQSPAGLYERKVDLLKV